MREGNPVLWTICDPRPDGLLVVEYPYFETEGVHFREETTYAGSGVVNSPDIISFNHGLGEIFTAMPDAGMTMRSLQEHREVPPECTRRRDGVKSRASRRVCPGYST